MARLSRSARLLRNAEAALISAIEIYNKPAFAYREETFAILALNAWELLLKAKLLKLNANRVRCLHIYSTREIAPGVQSKKLYVKRNRTGNKMTVGIEGCLARLGKDGIMVPEAVKKNYLDPSNTGSLRKDFYNPNIIAEFDKAYTRKK